VEFCFYEELLPELPHPPIPLRVLLIVEEALVRAWEILREHPRRDLDLLTAHEDTLTHGLYETVYDVVFNSGLVDGFDGRLFTTVTRETKLRTFDGRSLDKMPDLLVGLVGRDSYNPRSQDWLFIECKPVNAKHSVGMHYCDRGLIRFVKGDYAWAMREAMMVGYAREGYAISPRLEKALKDRADTIPTDSYPECCPHSKATQFSERVQISTHRRTFHYVETDTAAPPIAIRHLWLRRG
jgi:hypothetical protein